MKRPQQFCSAVMMMWLLLSSCDQKQETEQILTATDSFGSTARLISAFKRCPDQRKRKSVTPRNPLTCLSASEISSITSGSTPSSNRLNTGFPDCHTIGRIAAVITSPTIGSANGYPNHTPTVAQETVDSYGKTYSEEIEKLVALTRKA